MMMYVYTQYIYDHYEYLNNFLRCRNQGPDFQKILGKILSLA